MLYATHDVTQHLLAVGGDHVVGVELGNGWWNPMGLRFWGGTDIRGALTVGQGRGNGTTTAPMFRLKIVGTMSDGSQKTLLSSSSGTGGAANWTAASSPTTFNDIYLGEKYNATLDPANAGPHSWSTVGAHDGDTAGWAPAVPLGSGKALNMGTLEPQAVPPIRRQGVLATTVVSTVTSATNTTVVLDSGKNHAGVCRFRLTGKKGDTVVMRYGELLNANGKTLNPMTSVAGQIKGPTENTCIRNPGRSVATGLHVAYQADELTLSGRADDWTPAYSWHGFRYIEVTAPLGVSVDATSVECYPMRTDVDLVANFSSSDPVLEQLRTLNRNTFDSNMMSIQSDCPHRERFGYGGDALGCAEAGLSIYDWSTFYAKRARDYTDAQSVDPSTGAPAAFTECAPFNGVRCGGCGADGGFVGGLPGFPKAGGQVNRLLLRQPYTMFHMSTGNRQAQHT